MGKKSILLTGLFNKKVRYPKAFCKDKMCYLTGADVRFKNCKWKGRDNKRVCTAYMELWDSESKYGLNPVMYLKLQRRYARIRSKNGEDKRSETSTTVE